MAGRVSVVDEGKIVQHGEIIGVYLGQRSSLPLVQTGGGGGGGQLQYTPPTYHVSAVSLSKYLMTILALSSFNKFLNRGLQGFPV